MSNAFHTNIYMSITIDRFTNFMVFRKKFHLIFFFIFGCSMKIFSLKFIIFQYMSIHEYLFMNCVSLRSTYISVNITFFYYHWIKIKFITHLNQNNIFKFNIYITYIYFCP